MKLSRYIVIILLFHAVHVYSQRTQNQFKFWRLTSISGQATVKGNYREYTTKLNDIVDKQTETFVNGILQVQTRSYFIHPNFMLVNLNGIYNPETRRRKYLGIPDNLENNNREGVDLTVLFFQKKNANLTVNASSYNNLQNIDNLTRVREKTEYWGGVFSYRNKILPFTLGYNQQKTDQKTLDTERRFRLDQQIFQATANKSFSKRDRHSFNYLHSINNSSQTDVGSISPSGLNSSSDVIELSDGITLGKNNGISYGSSLSTSKQKGYIDYSSNSIQQSLSFHLPYHFNLANNFDYRNSNLDSVSNSFNRFQSVLSHQLYASLTSRFAYEHWRSLQDSYNEKRDKYSADLRYLKQIPNGKIILSYGYSREYQSVSTPPTSLYIFRDEYTLSDTAIVLLKNQYVNLQSIVVKNTTGSTIYQLNQDYLLIDRNPYVEIIRIPGGLISNNSQVYLDYLVNKPGLYKYVMNGQNFVADIWTLNNKLDTYYHMYTQGYENTINSEYQVLNTITRNVFGTRISFSSLSAGIEYEYCKSSILPYTSLSYFLEYQKMYRKYLFLINGRYSDYKMSNEDSRRKDLNLQSKLAYSITPIMHLNLNYIYRSMKGHGIELTIHTTKLDLTTSIRSLYLSVGTELYWSKSLGTQTNYKGGFVQLTRNF
jgi:hypothetical protein